MNTKIIILYDIYGALLTDKQRSYFEDYYFKNLTLSEISEKYNINTKEDVENIFKFVDNVRKLDKYFIIDWKEKE